MLDATHLITSAGPGAWATLSIPLACFADRAANLSSVAAPFALRTDGQLAITFSDIRLARTKTQHCDPTVVASK
jgi:beta-glucosidase